MSARSLNKVLLIGNLTRDPNLRFTPNGTAVCSFGLATNRSWTPSDGGDRQEKVEFHNIVAWSKLAEICGQLLHKGDKVFTEGRIQTREWKSDDGQDRRITEIVIDNMMLLKSQQGQGGSYNSDEYAETAAPAASATKSVAPESESYVDQDSASSEDVADDIPF